MNAWKDAVSSLCAQLWEKLLFKALSFRDLQRQKASSPNVVVFQHFTIETSMYIPFFPLLTYKNWPDKPFEPDLQWVPHTWLISHKSDDAIYMAPPLFCDIHSEKSQYWIFIIEPVSKYITPPLLGVEKLKNKQLLTLYEPLVTVLVIAHREKDKEQKCSKKSIFQKIDFYLKSLLAVYKEY